MLDQVRVRLSTPDAQVRWDDLIAPRHFLKTATLVGERLRYIVERDRQWLALLGWSAAANALNPLLKEQTAQIENRSTQPRPKGLGKLTEQNILCVVCDPKRFHNRRQVPSYLGLGPGEHRSGPRQQRQSSTQTGNPRLPWALCEAAWPLARFQPDDRLCKNWRETSLNPKTCPGRRAQLIVALARGFGADWWRLCAGQTTAEKLGLVLAD